MRLVESPDGMQRLALDARRGGQTIAFVPTMGYLHDGHLSLLRAARQQGDLVVLSIFVNPKQFGPGEDFAVYPRDFNRDAELARSVGTDIIFATGEAAMYPEGYSTYVEVEGLSQGLCGGSRPHHFRGVTTVVTKLFNIVQPHRAFFGQKDFQQLAIIRRMTRDLNLPVEVVGLPIVREADGLAMSSRNVRLSPDHRAQALCLVQALQAASAAARAGTTDAEALRALARQRIAQAPDAVVDYIEICHRDSLQPMATVTADSVMLLAVKIGAVRLIDNHLLHEELIVR